MGGNLHRSPVVSPRFVLDIATGTGIWAINFAKQNPQSQVVGTDISLIQCETVPPNVSFIKEDSEKDEWIFPYRFDFVFLRMVFMCFEDPRIVINKAYENMSPGGWIEFNDTGSELACMDGTTQGSALQMWSDLFAEAGRRAGRDLEVAAKYKQWLLDAGFVDVVEEILPTPSKSSGGTRNSGLTSLQLRLTLTPHSLDP